MFIAAWSTYGFETAVCYTSEFKNPGTDTFKAIFYSGLLCLLLFILVPFTFQGVLGLERHAGDADRRRLGRRRCHGRHGRRRQADPSAYLVMLMILALVLAIMTAMAGSSRTLYQGSVDGWLPRYLSHVNAHGAPTRGDVDRPRLQPVPAGHRVGRRDELLLHPRRVQLRLHHLQLPQPQCRLDPPHRQRPYRAAVEGADAGCIGVGCVFAFVNAMFMGAGAKVWNPMALWAGLITAALIIPVFCFRHYVQDGGKFPPHMLDDLGMTRPISPCARRACCPI